MQLMTIVELLLEQNILILNHLIHIVLNVSLTKINYQHSSLFISNLKKKDEYFRQ